MSMAVRDVLREPQLGAADPVVVAGAGPAEAFLDRRVTWVHTSEVLHVARLLRGGEFLLVGGVVLRAVGRERRRRYVRELAERSVAALAVECGPGMSGMPLEMCETADEVGLPLVELRRVVPFVEVCQTVNGQLAHESVHRLQVGDRISHVLIDALSDGADLPELLAVLADQVASDVELRGLDGAAIASAVGPDGSEDSAGSAAGQEGMSAPVVVTGLTMAVLTITPRRAADTTLWQVALEKAPEVLAIALLRSRPPSARDHAAHDFIGLALDGDAGSSRFAELGHRLDLDRKPCFAAVVAELAHPTSTSGIETVLGRRGREVVAQVRDGQFLSVVSLDSAGGRGTLLADVEGAALPADLQVVVGPAANRLMDVPRSLHEAVRVQGMECRRDGPVVVDSADYAVESLLLRLDDAAVGAFIRDQLGDLLHERRDDRGLVATLSAYIRHWGRKVDTADALHLGRQGLYRRMETIFASLGGLRPGSGRVGAVVVATELEVARRRLLGTDGPVDHR